MNTEKETVMADKVDYANLFNQSQLAELQQMEKKSPSLLGGLTKPAKKPKGGHGFLVTEKEDEQIRRGETPSTFSRGKDGSLRPKVQ
jgi:hypothetical protein